MLPYDRLDVLVADRMQHVGVGHGDICPGVSATATGDKQHPFWNGAGLVVVIFVGPPRNVPVQPGFYYLCFQRTKF